MATLTVYPSAGDGQVFNGESTWQAAHDGGGDGDVANYTATTSQVASGAPGGTPGIRRSFLPFDTSSLPNDATITAVLLKIYVISIDTENSPTDSVSVIQTSQASTSSLAVTDYNSVGTTKGATDVLVSTLTTSAYNTFTFNATGLGWISLTGFSLIGLRLKSDNDNSDPGSVYTSVNFSTSEQSGTSQDPKLEITYTTPTTTSTTSSTSTTKTTTSTSRTTSTTRSTSTTTSVSVTTSTSTSTTRSTSSSTTSTTSSTSTTSTSSSTTSTSTTSTSTTTTMALGIVIDNV